VCHEVIGGLYGFAAAYYEYQLLLQSLSKCLTALTDQHDVLLVLLVLPGVAWWVICR
jgi:hypothetical protein